MVELTSALSVIGGAWLLFTGLYLVIDKVFSRTRFSLAKAGGFKNGGWAIVTGASDGIGKAYAVELAKRGFNLLLLSRTESKLQDTKKEIESASGVKVDYISVDFEKIDEEQYSAIERKIAGLEKVGILVNNVGVNYDYPLNFGEASVEQDEKIINVNITVTNRLTRMALPRMIENKAGAIINLSSMTGVIPTPLLAIYSGTKAYLDSFAQCLHAENEKKGVVAQSVVPGLVVSNMSKIKRANLMTCMPSVIVKGSLDSLGKKVQVSPYWFHRLLIRVQLALPRRLILTQLANYNIGIRKRAEKRRAAN